MTAELTPSFPMGDQAQVDETVRRTIDALIRGRELTRDEAAIRAGIDRATLYRRLAGRGSQQAFKAGEVAALARLLDVPVASIYDGLGGVFTPPPTTAGESPSAAQNAKVRGGSPGIFDDSVPTRDARDLLPLAPVTHMHPSRVPSPRTPEPLPAVA